MYYLELNEGERAYVFNLFPYKAFGPFPSKEEAEAFYEEHLDGRKCTVKVMMPAEKAEYGGTGRRKPPPTLPRR
jgi:hypothetical protein